jgi:hypothetical protein
VKLALSLLDKVGSRESAGEVFSFGAQVRAYVEPLQAAMEYQHEGCAAAMASGDVNLAAGIRHVTCANLLFAGVNLQTMREKYSELMKFLEERKMAIFMVVSQYVKQSIFKLIGTDEDPKHVSSEEQNILASNNSVRTTYYFHKAYISFVYRSYEGTKENTEKCLACISNTWADLVLAHAFQAFYVGLISFWLARKAREEQHWFQRGNNSKLALKKWTESSQWTFENKWYLLEAEESFCNNDFDFEAAKTYYEKTVLSARNHKVRGCEQTRLVLLTYWYHILLTCSLCYVLLYLVRTRRSIGM